MAGHHLEQQSAGSGSTMPLPACPEVATGPRVSAQVFALPAHDASLPWLALLKS